MARHKDEQWDLAESQRDSDGVWRTSNEVVELSLLMDLRDELKRLNNILNVLRCPDFLAIPRILKAIRANTEKPRKKPKMKLVKRRAA